MFSWLKNRRRRQLLAEPFPKEWLTILKRNVPYYAFVSPDQRDRLRDDLRIFIAEKQWVGCNGLEVTDEMRVTIAAQACLLLLGIEANYHYDRIKSLLIYPRAYRQPAEMQRGTLVVNSDRMLLGEAWHRSPIVLSWSDVLAGSADPHDGHNVVFHEFAHHLDGLDGSTDGTPPLESRQQYRDWDHVMADEYQRLVDAARSGTPSLLSYYGATNRAEFFAVATEVFFELGRELKREQPELYAALGGFYRQDPASWPPGPARDQRPERQRSQCRHCQANERHAEQH